MKALILAAGPGKRLKAQTKEHNKCMFSVFGKPLIEHSLITAASLKEIDEIIIVVGHMAEQIINAYGTKYQDKTVKYRIQSPLKGPVGAIEAALLDLESEDFLLLFGSELVVQGRYQEMIKDFYHHKLSVSCGVVPASEKVPYSVIQDEKGFIYRLVEKPARLVNKWMGTGSCVFQSSALEYSASVPVHPVARERTLPDLIQTAVDNGHPVKSFNLGNDYVSINTKEDLDALEKPVTFYQ
ncbi:Nucleotidyl transferase [Desulfonatronospira thiodismutans ASO3-1]|uniref:Nucleotidyl transferase n=1 Tax=Desulfonatronospira thiodismutans ASO3-1 TaxID=555779 RepID=D6SLK5_9BACT|nr:sugar phosphate nucleotidyltransferase [Desulfonatronospira thiodismutans]EFI35566.1 Nucleotidyl transferase [Desulfonatronospira thiodismutans ASO3-1]